MLKPTPLKTLFNVQQAADYLNLKNKQTLYNWIHQRKGPNYVKIGRLCMWELSELNKYIESNRVLVSSE